MSVREPSVQDLNDRHTAVLLTVEEMHFDKEMQRATAEKVHHFADLEQDVRASTHLMLSELKACRDAVRAELQSAHLSVEVAARSERERNELGVRLRQVCRPFLFWQTEPLSCGICASAKMQCQPIADARTGHAE